jgi:PAS domain S-box-containing protein
MIRVLYVDDEINLLEIAKLFLESTNEISVDTLDSPVVGIETMDLRRYDVIVSDYLMPEIDGIEFLKRVRSKYGDIPFILFTGRGREEVVIDAINYGADFYLQKGGDPKSQFAELAHKIRQVVRRTSAEGLLKQNESWLQSIINYSDDTIFLMNQDGAIIYSSPSAETIFGYSSAFLTGKNHIALAHPDDANIIRAELADVFNKEHVRHPVNYRIRRDDGTYIFVESVFTCLFDVVGIQNIIVTTRDMTELNNVQNALTDYMARFNRVEKLIHAGHWMLSVDTQIVTMSDGARILFGLSGREYLLPDLKKLLPDEYRLPIDDALNAVMKNGESYDIQYKIKRSGNGSMISIHSIVEHDPEKRKIFGVLQEIPI